MYNEGRNFRFAQIPKIIIHIIYVETRRKNEKNKRNKPESP
jgi:hypothetical protein